ncbi:MAG: D-arabinono-1,4-lactone oxidase [Gammaproteobacteria bacterium]
MRITNFGGNVSFTPRHWYAPRNEAEVLDLLNKHAGAKIRVVASLHSWSDVAVSEDVVVDMRNFDSVEIAETGDGEVSVTAGSGCGLQRLLDIIHGATDSTLPSLGAIKEQKIAGAISTATHGSGKHSLSHYMDELRMAAYDADTGGARIYEWKDGTELRAGRCSLGCMGILLSIKFRCVPKYYVAESVARYETLEDALAQEDEFPLQQFTLIPYLWSYFVYHRRTTMTRPPWWASWRVYLDRAYKLIGVDIMFHLIVKALVASSHWGGPGIVRWFYQELFPAFIVQNQTVVDFSENVLTLKHHYFKHEEMEIFIPARHIREAVELVRHATSLFAGTSETTPDGVASKLRTVEMLDTLMRYRGSYTHHYPIFFRRVLPDDTLISMTSNSNEPYYTISFFTYLKPKTRTQFYEFAGFLARSLTRLYDARLHWGKYYPLTNAEIEGVYPRLKEFRQTCQKTDPNGVFRNEYTERVLGFVDG